MSSIISSPARRFLNNSARRKRPGDVYLRTVKRLRFLRFKIRISNFRRLQNCSRSRPRKESRGPKSSCINSRPFSKFEALCIHSRSDFRRANVLDVPARIVSSRKEVREKRTPTGILSRFSTRILYDKSQNMCTVIRRDLSTSFYRIAAGLAFREVERAIVGGLFP